MRYFFILYNVLMNSRFVFFIIALSFVFASFLQSVFLSFYFSFFLLLLSFFALCFAWLEKEKMFLYPALFFISTALFSFYFLQTQNKNEQIRQYFLEHYPDKFEAMVQLIAPPDKRENYSFLTLRLCDEYSCVNVRAKYLGYKELQYAGTISVMMRLKNFENFDKNFDYKKFMESKDILLEAEIYDLKVLLESEGLLAKLFAFKDYLKANLFKNLSYASAALAAGLILGEKQALDADTMDLFQKSGLTHIVVLSGYNISVISIAIFYILFFLARKIRLLLSIFFIVLFVLMVGPDAPTLRAGLMGVLSLLALLFRRQAEAAHLLFVSAVVLLILKPLSVLYDPGFQLSYIVTLGIVSFAPRLLDLDLLSSLSYLKEILASSTVASLLASPIITYYMGSVSLTSVFANLLVLPIVPVAMAVSAPLMFAHASFLSSFAFVAEFLLRAIVQLADVFAIDALQFSAYVSAPALFALYFVFLIYAGFVALRR